MTINHPLYGRFNITEPVLIDLINSPALRRLKRISQHGCWQFYRFGPEKFNRFEHSLGVLLLLRKFGAPIEEQIAGLLHDVSHTAFSHVGDRLFGRELTQDYQDSKLAKAFDLQGINKILKKHGFKPEVILDFSKFNLLETELPDLCADRLDYTFQDPAEKKINGAAAKKLLKKLRVYKNRFVFADRASAEGFGRLYLKLNQLVWCNPKQVTLFVLLAQALKIGLEKNIISKKDLFTDDQTVRNKLQAAKNPEIAEKFRLMKNLRIKIVPKNQVLGCSKTKIRIVDPGFLKNGKLIRLSAIDQDYKNKIAAFKKWAKNGFCVKILNK